MPDTISLNQFDPVVGTVDDALPVFNAVDFVGDRKQFIVAQVRDACRQFGFFYIDLDDTQQSVVNKALEEMSRFFAISDDDPMKQRIRQGTDDTGWVPSGSEPAYQPGTVSSLEAFDCDREDIDGRGARNVWPDLPGFRNVITECWSTYANLANDILDVLSRVAGVSPDFFVTQCDTQELNTLRLLHYAARPPGDSESNVGIAAHTDFECITFDLPGCSRSRVDRAVRKVARCANRRRSNRRAARRHAGALDKRILPGDGPSCT